MARHHYTIVEAVALLQTGGKARRADWERGLYIILQDRTHRVGPDGHLLPSAPPEELCLTRDDILAEDWEVFA